MPYVELSLVFISPIFMGMCLCVCVYLSVYMYVLTMCYFLFYTMNGGTFTCSCTLLSPLWNKVAVTGRWDRCLFYCSMLRQFDLVFKSDYGNMSGITLIFV